MPPAAPGREPRIEGYSALDVIGHGASATVYQATQDGYDRRVALKVLNIDISDRRAQRRFQRERALNGRLSDHPNVVTVLDSGFVDGRYPYLAMELFELGSLSDQLRQRGPFTVPAALHIGVRIAGALESAHRLGVLHRDVKPQNILQSRFGEPALADFGIAAILELEMEHSLTAALTPVHAAPELLEGGDPSERTDVYALASTIFTVLAGSPPFAGPAGEGMLAQLLRIATNDLPPLARTDVPSALTDVLREAMAKRPTERTPSAAAFGNALRRLQHELGLPMTPMPVGTDAGAVIEPPPTLATASLPDAPASVPRALPPPAPPVGPAWPEAADRDAAGPDASQRTEVVEPVRIDGARDGRVAAVDARTVDGPIDAPTVTARHVAPAIPAPSPRRRWPVAVACVIAIAVGIGAVAGGARLLDRRSSGRSATSAVPVTTATSPLTTDTTAGPSTTVTPTVPADVSAIAPTDLVVSTDGGRVLLSWTDHTNGQAPQVVYTYTSGAAPAPTPVSPAGARSQVIPDISPTTPACFVVAVVVSIGQDPSSPAQTVKSDPKCINNAVAKPTAP